MLRTLALLLTVLSLLAPAFAAGAERSMPESDAACGCCCADHADASAPGELPSVESAPECACSVPPNVPPTAPLEAPLTHSGSADAALDLQRAPAVLPLPAPVVRVRTDGGSGHGPPDAGRRALTGVWLL